MKCSKQEFIFKREFVLFKEFCEYNQTIDFDSFDLDGDRPDDDINPILCEEANQFYSLIFTVAVVSSVCINIRTRPVPDPFQASYYQ